MESKVDIYKKRIGQLCWISAEKSVLEGFTLLGHEDFTRCSNTCGTLSRCIQKCVWDKVKVKALADFVGLHLCLLLLLAEK